MVNAEKLLDYEVFYNLSNAFVRIATNDNQTFVDISSELPETKYPILRTYSDSFIRVFLPQISPNELDSIHSNLLTGKYQNYDRYTFKDIDFALNEQKLDNGDISYKFIIEIPNKSIKDD